MNNAGGLAGWRWVCPDIVIYRDNLANEIGLHPRRNPRLAVRDSHAFLPAQLYVVSSQNSKHLPDN